MQRHSGLARDARDLGDRLNHAQLIVGMHNRDQPRIRPQRAPHIVGIHQAARANRQNRDGRARALELRAGGQHRRVLDRARDDVRRPRSQQRQVVCLRAAAREYQLGGAGVDQRRQLPPRPFQPLFGRLSEMMDAGSVTIHLTETRHQRLQYFGSDRRGGVVVEIEALH